VPAESPSLTRGSRRSLELAAATGAALRQHPLRALLSILGLVIGVAALVGILSLGDGLERFAREQVATTTDLQNILVVPQTSRVLDGVVLRRDTVVHLGAAQIAALAAELGGAARVVAVRQRPVAVRLGAHETAAQLIAADTGAWALREARVSAGRLFTSADVAAGRAVVVLAAPLAAKLAAGDGAAPESLPGRTLRLGADPVEVAIVGVLEGSMGGAAELYGPLETLAGMLGDAPPRLLVRVERAEEVQRVADRIRAWLDAEAAAAGGAAAFNIRTDVLRTDQIRRGMRLFKLVLGLIAGLSVLVGGIGVMNVLLIAVVERTREIGIRKAIGARRADIRLQFLAEAMAISVAGSVAGLVVGFAGVVAVTPVIRELTDTAFRPALSASTLATVGLVALAVGLAFGTYPAARAARLSPVEAMRQE
jgi:putative ABC transport system permease protein